MTKKLIALLLAAMLCLSLLAACGDDNDILTQDEAIKVAMKDAGLSQKNVSDVHAHPGQYDGTPSYEIHIEAKDGKAYTYHISAIDGAILAQG